MEIAEALSYSVGQCCLVERLALVGGRPLRKVESSPVHIAQEAITQAEGVPTSRNRSINYDR